MVLYFKYTSLEVTLVLGGGGGLWNRTPADTEVALYLCPLSRLLWAGPTTCQVLDKNLEG